MDLIYIFLILLSFGNQLPPIQPLGRLSLFNQQTSRCTINVLPRDFPKSETYQYLEKLQNNSTVQEETPNELDGQPKAQAEFTKEAFDEVKDWFPELYSYIPACNKQGKCTAIILKFTPEQLQKDNGKAFEYLLHKELGQSKAVSSVEEAINSKGEKLIIATIDEETVLNGFYESLIENKTTILQIICGLGVIFGLFLAFAGKKAINALLFAGGFIVTALVVNFWEYPGRLNANSLGEPAFYTNLALVVGAGLSAGILLVKAQKIFLCVFLALVGVGAGAYFWYFMLNDNETFILILFGVIAAGILYSLAEFILKNYNELTALSTGFYGAVIFGLSIIAYYVVNVTKQGFELQLDELTARQMMLVFWVSFFVLIYGVKFQLGIKGKRQRGQGKGKVPAGGAPVVGGGGSVGGFASVPKKQEVPEKPKNIKPQKPGKKKLR